MPTLTLTGEPDADRLLSDNAFALLLGMLLDQQSAWPPGPRGTGRGVLTQERHHG